MKKLISRFFVVFLLSLGFLGGQCSAQRSEEVVPIQDSILRIHFINTVFKTIDAHIRYLRKSGLASGLTSRLTIVKISESRDFLDELCKKPHSELLFPAFTPETREELDTLMKFTSQVIANCVHNKRLVTVEDVFVNLKKMFKLCIYDFIDDIKKLALKMFEDRFAPENRSGLGSLAFIEYEGRDLDEISYYFHKYKRFLHCSMIKAKKLRGLLKPKPASQQEGCSKRVVNCEERLKEQLALAYDHICYYFVAYHECRRYLEEHHPRFLNGSSKIDGATGLVEKQGCSLQ